MGTLWTGNSCFGYSSNSMRRFHVATVGGLIWTDSSCVGLLSRDVFHWVNA